MTDWSTFEDEAPELAGEVRAALTAARHHVLATLRKDGAPRLSGTEVLFRGRELALGSMWQARKALDLRRDPRFALHTNPGDGAMARADAKLSGRAAEVGPEDVARYATGDEPPGPFHVFTLDLHEVAAVGLTPERDALLVRLWRPGRGVTETRRT